MTTKSIAVELAPGTSKRRAVLRLGLPAAGEQFLNLLVGLADTYLVGNMAAATVARVGYGTETALAAVGTAQQIVWTLTTLFMAVAMGTTVLVAREIGAGNPEEANRVLRQSLLLGAGVGLLATLLSFIFARPMMGVLGAAPEVIDQGAVYLQIATLAMLPAALMFVCSAALRGAGDTRTPLYAMLVVNALNIAVAWLLVNGNLGLPALGVAGSAWGAAVGRGAGGVLLIAILLRGRSGLKLEALSTLRPRLMWRVLRLGLPFAAEQFVFQGALLIFVRVINSLGVVAFAAHSVTITVESISFLPGFGFAVAATTLVSQHLGAHQPEAAEESGHEAFRQAAIFMGTIGVLLFLMPRVFLGFFVDDRDVVEMAVRPLQLVGLTQPLLAALFIYSGALRGAGDVKFPLLSKLFSTWLVRLPLALLLVEVVGWGLTGAWIAMITDFTIQGIISWLRFRQGKWRTIKV
ncbi:MAG: MATE efflux family protein [Herpetosiphonaceae bacterium]|nr:MAG: MATE efflux family protein [Herpetosiphonaceae bacterium]